MTNKYFVNSDKTERHVIDKNYVGLLPSGLIEISKTEYDKLVADSQVKTDTEKLLGFKVEVQAALDKSDMVALRAFKAGVAFNAEWATCVEKLREQMAITEWSDDLTVITLPTTYPS